MKTWQWGDNDPEGFFAGHGWDHVAVEQVKEAPGTVECEVLVTHRKTASYNTQQVALLIRRYGQHTGAPTTMPPTATAATACYPAAASSVVCGGWPGGVSTTLGKAVNRSNRSADKLTRSLDSTRRQLWSNAPQLSERQRGERG